MTSQQAGLLVIQLIASVAVLAVLGVLLLRAHEEHQKYQLFALRDRLVYLAATGVLPETSMVFKVFYRAMNTFIVQLESITLISFVRASIAVKAELEREKSERLVDAVRRSAPEVQAVIDEFFEVLMRALTYNSPALNVVLVVARHCRRLVLFVRKHWRGSIPVYDTYRYYERMHGQMAFSHQPSEPVIA